jgi:hypothetical protein
VLTTTFDDASYVRQKLVYDLWRDQGSAASSLCTTAPPLYTRCTNIFGASVSEATMRPNPRREMADHQGARRLTPKAFFAVVYLNGVCSRGP